MTQASAAVGAPRALVLLAFLALYLIWGSTYLAIRFGVETLPPFLMAAARFAVAGVALYAFCRWRGVPPPTASQWRATSIIGILLLFGGTGLVTWAEQWVPSGLAALLVAAMPIWMIAIGWGLEPAHRPGIRAILGAVLGVLGVGFLVRPSGDLAVDPLVFRGALTVIAATVFWACGSLYSRRADVPPNAFLSTAMQMIVGSVSLAFVGVVLGEVSRVDFAATTAKSWLALAYLTTFGSIVAFSAYIWLLRVSTPAKVTTYAFVNPAVAVFLGWLLGGEELSRQTMIAATVIVIAVAMITTERRRECPS